MLAKKTTKNKKKTIDAGQYDQHPWVDVDYKPIAFKDLEAFAGEGFGFIYEITNLATFRKYIGRKYFTMAGSKQVNGKRKRIRKVSDWADYWGSNDPLLADIAKLGKSRFQRRILLICPSKGITKYMEAWLLFTRNVLTEKTLAGERAYYNDWIQIKTHRVHLGKDEAVPKLIGVL